MIALLYFVTVSLLSTAQAAVRSSGCGKALPPGFPAAGAPSQRLFICSGGRNRTYLLSTPVSYDISQPAPLLFSFHGGTKTASEQELLSQFSDPEFNTNAVAIYPQGIKVRPIL